MSFHITHTCSLGDQLSLQKVNARDQKIFLISVVFLSIDIIGKEQTMRCSNPLKKLLLLAFETQNTCFAKNRSHTRLSLRRGSIQFCSDASVSAKSSGRRRLMITNKQAKSYCPDFFKCATPFTYRHLLFHKTGNQVFKFCWISG